MNLSDAYELYHPLLMAYVAGLMGLAALSMFICLFYRKRLKQPAPWLTFAVAVLAGALFLASYLLIREGWLTAVRRAQAYLLFVCGVASMYGSLALYFTMKKVRK
jgi:CHASE2 domain-containing sensor protein